MDYAQYVKLSTLICDEGASACGVHHDPIAPLPSLVAGPGGWAWDAQRGWQQIFRGGRLFLADGLWDISYGPHDAVIIDGRFAHGVTHLREMSSCVDTPRGRPERERFSLILFNTFKREKMKSEATLRGREERGVQGWDDSWYPSVVWRAGSEPKVPVPQLPAQRISKRPARFLEDDS